MAELILSRLINQNTLIGVVSYTSFDNVPASAKKYTIAAITDLEINHSYLSTALIEQPENGDIVVLTKKGDLLDFSTENTTYAFSIFSVQQYTETGWKNIKAYLYTGSEWVQISAEMVTLYNRGYREDVLTGGWGITLADGGAAAWNDEYFRLGKNSLDSLLFAAAYTNQGIDVSSYTILRVVMSIPSRETSSDDPGKYRIVIGLSPEVYTGYGTGQAESACSASMSIASTFSAEQTFDLDISQLTGPHHLQLSHWGCNCNFYEIYLM